MLVTFSRRVAKESSLCLASVAAPNKVWFTSRFACVSLNPRFCAAWAKASGLPGLTAQGLPPALHAQVAEAALTSSSMKGNPVALTTQDLIQALQSAA